MLITKSSINDPCRPNFRCEWKSLLIHIHVYFYICSFHSLKYRQVQGEKTYFNRIHSILQYHIQKQHFFKRLHGILVQPFSINCHNKNETNTRMINSNKNNWNAVIRQIMQKSWFSYKDYGVWLELVCFFLVYTDLTSSISSMF